MDFTHKSAITLNFDPDSWFKVHPITNKTVEHFLSIPQKGNNSKLEIMLMYLVCFGRKFFLKSLKLK